MPPSAALTAYSGNPQSARPAKSSTVLASLGVFVLLAILPVSCGHERHTYDPQLRQIDDLLSKELPVGTTRGRVDHFLRSRGYRIEGTPDKTVIRALVHHVDSNTLQPAAARATFHFDSNDKLTTFQLESAPDAPY